MSRISVLHLCVLYNEEVIDRACVFLNTKFIQQLPGINFTPTKMKKKCKEKEGKKEGNDVEMTKIDHERKKKGKMWIEEMKESRRK